MAEDAARPAHRRRGTAPAVLGLLVVVLGAALWLVHGELAEARAAQRNREAAIQAAGAHAVSLLSLDHRTIDQDLKRILDTSTGQARQEHAANAARIKEATKKGKVVQLGVLRSSGLVSMNAAQDTAEVLVVADAMVRWEGAKAAPQEQRFYRWRMRVTRVGGSWLVSKAEYL